MIDPIHEYSHNSGCESVTGAAFVPDGAWPVAYDDAYLFGDFVCGEIFSLIPDGAGGFTREQFASGLGPGPISMTFGPNGTGEALYYTTFAGGGQVRRIAPSDGNQTPVAVAAGNPNNWSPNLTIDLTGSESSDPDGDVPLTYEWDFMGDGVVDATGENVSHTYASSGRRSVTLRVRDARGGESTDTIDVFPGNTPPEPAIASPAAGSLFEVGEEITLDGSATDAGDDADGDSSTMPILEWEVLRHHDGNHTHPVFSGEGDGLAFQAPAPEELAATDPLGNYLEIRLTATDSQGLSSEPVVRDVRPDTVDVGFDTQPDGLKLKVNGETVRAPRTLVSWAGYELNVSAPRQRDRAGRTWAFKSWSDGGARDHAITTPDAPTTYTATFRRVRR